MRYPNKYACTSIGGSSGATRYREGQQNQASVNPCPRPWGHSLVWEMRLQHPFSDGDRMKRFSAIVVVALLTAAPAHSSVHIKPIYRSGQVWTGNTRVSFWNYGKQGVVIRYPVFDGCVEAKEYMVSAKAGSAGAGLFGRHQTMSWKEVNKLIREPSNSRPLGLQYTKYRRVTPSLRAVPNPSSPFVCGPGSSNYFPGWG